MSPFAVNPDQKPIASQFGMHSTASDVISGVDLQGRVAVVTGGAAGLGLETVRALSNAGATVVVGARRVDAARQAVEGARDVHVARLDLCDTASIDEFASALARRHGALDILVNNAGIMAVPLARDAQSHELQLSSNHIGHFRLTSRLWPQLAKSGSARVVALSSGAHRFSPVDLTDPDFERRPYDRWVAYGQSKTAVSLFALELDRRAKGHGVRAFAVHPGAIHTGLSSHLVPEDLVSIGAVDEQGHIKQEFQALFKSVEQGAATSVWCATSRELDGLGGLYCEDCGVATVIPADSTELRGVLPWAVDQVAARAWWPISERLAGVRFDIG